MEKNPTSKLETPKTPAIYTNFDRFVVGISDKTKITPMLDGIIQTDLERNGRDFTRLIKGSDAMKRFSRQFKSRVIFAILRSLPEGKAPPPYKEFIKTYCDGNRDFCSEGTYARHRAAQDFIANCKNAAAAKFYESLPGRKDSQVHKNTRGVEDKTALMMDFYESVASGKPDEKAAESLFNTALKKYSTQPEPKRGKPAPRAREGKRENKKGT